MEIKLIEKVFHDDLMYLLRKEIDYLKTMPQGVYVDNEDFNRIYAHNNPFFRVIHEMITDRFCVWVNEKVKPSYNFTSMYFAGYGRCRFHKDRPQCKYSLDLCVGQNYPWGITVNEKEYFLKEGDGLIYSGTDHLHGRKEVLKHDNYCDLIFFHFVLYDFEDKLD